MTGYYPITIHDVTAALEALRHVQRPYGDNEGDPINHPCIYDDLPPPTQEAIDSAWHHVREYCSNPDGTIKLRGVTAVKKRGYEIYLGPNQNDPYSLSGSVTVGDWELNLSDASGE